METDWIVFLERGEKFDTLAYGPESHARAAQRVSSLCMLHGDCKFRVDHVQRRMYVEANKWYDTK
jgi:hypothetical protein